MSPLLDALSSLSSQSTLISQLSSTNTTPSGPFTNALLSSSSVLDIIRDAEDHERRLFRYIGEQQDGKGKMVEKRGKGMITPLRNGIGNHLNGQGGGGGDGEGWSDPNVLLKTALKLVDEYRPMPRARAHILDLIEKHTDTQNSIIALEDSIEDASHPSHGPSESLSLFDEEPTFDHDEDHEEIHKQSPEEWLKKEEDELKKLEADVAELRKQKRTQAQSSPKSPSIHKSTAASSSTPSPRSAIPPPSSRRLANSPLASLAPPSGSSIIRTPKSASTPKFTLRPAPSPSRIEEGTTPSPSPLTSTFGVVGGGRGAGTTPEGLSRSQIMREQEAFGLSGGARKGGLGRSVIGKKEVKAESPKKSETQAKTLSVETPGSSRRSPRSPGKINTPLNGTPRSPRTPGTEHIVSSPLKVSEVSPSTPQEVSMLTSNENTPTPKAKRLATPSTTSKRKVIEGVEVRGDVRNAVNKIWTTLGEFMRQGEGSPLPDETLGTAQTIKHILHLSTSPLPPPLSPSTSSSLSTLLTTSTYRPPPLTSHTILLSTLLLHMLRSPSLTLTLSEAKELLGTVVKEQGWDDQLGLKTIYSTVAKKTITIDRRKELALGGELVFNI